VRPRRRVNIADGFRIVSGLAQDVRTIHNGRICREDDIGLSFALTARAFVVGKP
jgi:hypothetical protein